MAEQTPPPMNGVIPHLTIKDGRAKEAVEFYRRAFEVESEPGLMPADDGKRLMHAHLKVNGGDLMLADEFPEYSGPGETGSGPPDRVVLHIDAGDVDAAFARGIALGATERMPPADMFWGQRYAQFTDPYGFAWSLGGPLKGDAQ